MFYFLKEKKLSVIQNILSSPVLRCCALCVLTLFPQICLFVIPQALTRLYLDKATLIWNGNAVSGQEALNEFFEMLPSSEFQVNVLDCQPVHGKLLLLFIYLVIS